MTVPANWQMPLAASNPKYRRYGSYDYAPTGRAGKRALAKQERRQNKQERRK